MKRKWKRIGSLILSVCMVFTMLPTMTFAETVDVDSGTPRGVSGTITAFAELSEEVAEQTVETGTAEDELNLPDELTVTVTGAAITATVSGNDTATDSEAEEPEKAEPEEVETTVDVSGWTSDPAYDGDITGVYTFTPSLALPKGLTVTEGVYAPQIAVTVEEADAPLLRGGVSTLAAGDIEINETNFPDLSFRWWLESQEYGRDRVLTVTEIAEITSMNVSGKNIFDLTGIEYFTALTDLYCSTNRLTTLDVSNNTALTDLYCYNNELTMLDVSNNTALTNLSCNDNQLTALDVSGNTALTILSCHNNELTTLDVSGNTALTVLSCHNNQLTALDVSGNAALNSLDCNTNQLTTLDVNGNTKLVDLNCSKNYMADETAITGLDKILTTSFIFEPQNTPGGPDITTEAQLKAALESATPSTINVTADITLTEAVEVKADHTLTIASGATLILGNIPSGLATLFVPDGKTLTINGAGTLAVQNTEDSSIGIMCMGEIAIREVALTVKNEGALSNGINLYGSAAKLTATDCAVEISNTNSASSEQYGIRLMNASATFDGGTVSIKNQVNVGTGIDGYAESTITFRNGCAVTVELPDDGTGINLGMVSGHNDQLLIDGSTLEVTAGSGLRLIQSAALSGANGGKITLAQGADILLNNSGLKDQGHVLTNTDFSVTVGAADAAPSANGLTAGDYVWDGTYFTKGGSKLATPTGLTWDTATPGKAKWTAVDHAFTYTVRLYKDGAFKTASDPTITATEYDFTSFITETGVYTFTVTALAVAPNTSSDESAASPVYNYTVAPVFFDDTSVPTFFLPALPTSDTSGGSGGTAWTWDNTAKNLTLQGASAFILKGKASGEMRVLSPDTPVSLVLDGAAFESPAGYDALYLTKGGTVAVLANSHVTGGINADKLDIVLNDASLTVERNLGYAPSISTSDLTLSGTDTVEARSANGVAVFCAGDLTVGSGCTLNASGGHGIQFQGARTIRGGGTILANGETSFGIGENGAGKALTFDFTGLLEIRGKTYGILMVMNDSADKATVTFASKPASLLISSSKGIIGSINYEGTADVGTVTLGNTAKIPGLSEVFSEGGKEFPATSGTLLTITLNANGGNALVPDTLTTTNGKLDELPTPTRSGSYRFDGWFTAASGGTKVTTSTVFTANTTIYAHWTDTSSGGDGGSGGGGGYTPTPIIPTDKQPDMPTVAKPSASGTVKDGTLSATITEQMVKDALKAAQDAAKKSGKELDGIALDFNVTGSGSYTNLNTTIDAGAIDRLKEAGVKFIKIGSAVLDVTLDIGAIAEIDKQTSGTVTVSAKKITKLSDAAKKLIGNRPVFDITVSYQKNGKTEYVSNFGKGAVTLGIAYKVTDKESKGNLFGVYVDKNGKPQLLTNSSYDNSGRLIFSRNSLSTYGVGYKAPNPAFSDTAKHWAKDNIDFVASRDLISGTGATTFAPDTAITRADFLMALGRLSGADVSEYKVSSFSDVKAFDTGMPYIEWAVKNKIVSGYGNGKFGPNDSITREQMAVMMVNYAKATGYKLTVSKQAITFADNAKISTYAKDAVKAIQQTGVINGKDNNRFDPQGNATRAEAATILRRFVELVIDEGTARGWVQNDAGQWQWIGENGKPVVGWLTAENGKYHYYFTVDGIMVSGKWLEIEDKWYYFNTDGSLAKDTKVDGYEVDSDGARKTK